MKLDKFEFYLWREETEQWLRKINDYLDLDIYKIGYRGKRHKLCLLKGSVPIAYRIEDINRIIRQLIYLYIKKGNNDDETSF